jgi:hypothetical protein
VSTAAPDRSSGPTPKIGSARYFQDPLLRAVNGWHNDRPSGLQNIAAHGGLNFKHSRESQCTTEIGHQLRKESTDAMSARLRSCIRELNRHKHSHMPLPGLPGQLTHSEIRTRPHRFKRFPAFLAKALRFRSWRGTGLVGGRYPAVVGSAAPNSAIQTPSGFLNPISLELLRVRRRLRRRWASA